MKERIPPVFPEAVLLSSVVFGPLAFGAVESWSIAVLESLLVLAAVLCAVRFGIRPRYPSDRTLLPAALILIALGAAQFLNVRALGSPAAFLPFTAARAETGKALILWTSYAALLFAGPRILVGRAARVRFMWTVFLLGAVVAVIGLMQRGQGNQAYYGLRHIRHGNPFGPYTNYDHAASMLVLAAFAGLGLFAARLGALRRQDQLGKLLEGWMLQILIAFFLGVILYAIVYIRSRGAIHGMALAAALVSAAAIARFLTKRARTAALALLVGVCSVYGVYMVRHKVLIGFESSAPSAIFRLKLFQNSYEISRDFPIFGTGLASYEAVYPAYQDMKLIDLRVDHVHNDWLEMLIQTGIAGFMVYAAAVLAALTAGFKSWSARASFESRCLTAASLAAALSFCIHGFVDFSFQIPANAVLFLTLLICASAPANNDLELAAA